MQATSPPKTIMTTDAASVNITVERPPTIKIYCLYEYLDLR